MARRASRAASSPLPTTTSLPNSFVCDELDGRAARYFDQASVYGAVLDMVTDRLSTAGLLTLLAALRPASLWIPLSLLSLDIASHWAAAHAAAASGAASHKDTRNASLIVRLYYRHRLFMGACCVSCEVLYLAAYALAAAPGRWSVGAPAWLPGGGGGARGWLPFPAPPRRIPVAALFAAVSVPGTLVKQWCNWQQLRNAFAALAALDAGTRGPAGDGDAAALDTGTRGPAGDGDAAAPAAAPSRRRSTSRRRV